MRSLAFVIFILGVLGLHTILAQTNCEERTNFGQISDKQVLYRLTSYTKCWIIKVPLGTRAEIAVTNFRVDRTPYTSVYLKVGTRTMKPPQKGPKIMATSDVTITFYAENIRNAYPLTAEFLIDFRVGDGGSIEVEGMRKSRENALQLLQKYRFNNGGWREKTQDAMIAFHLANDTNFNENAELMLMASQLETRVALTASATENDVVGRNINALVTICADANNFHGKKFVTDLVEKTKTESENDGLAYLSLCISGIPLAKAKLDKIIAVMEGDDLEKKYYRAMALACAINRQEIEEKGKYEENFSTAVREIMDLQRMDGSFEGGVKTSAMYVQMLVASKEARNRLWNYENAVKYLMREMEKTPDFESLVFTLPILNGKTMADIMCMSSRKTGAMRENESMKTLTLRYEDSKVFSMTVEVEGNVTALQFLQIAANQDRNFRFQTIPIDGKINGLEIVGLPDDPITGKYWQFYYVRSNENNSSDFIAEGADSAEKKLEKGLDEFGMTNAKELILWYKTLDDNYKD